MDIAHKALLAGEFGQDTVIWAKSQPSGRGRQGRKWLPPKVGLYASYAIECPVDVSRLGEFSFVVGVAIHNALQHVMSCPLVLKWPNDLLLQDKKVCGILIERGAKDMGEYPTLVCGVGMNINQVHPDVCEIATALNDHSKFHLPLEMVLAAITNYMVVWKHRWLESGFESVLSYWTRNTVEQGTPIQFHNVDGKRMQGYFAGVSNEGHLRLSHTPQLDKIETFLTGDMFLEKNPVKLS